VCEGAAGDTECPGESEVGELDAAMNVNEEILRFEIAMDHSVAVAVRQSLQQLVQVTLHKHSSSTVTVHCIVHGSFSLHGAPNSAVCAVIQPASLMRPRQSLQNVGLYAEQGL